MIQPPLGPPLLAGVDDDRPNSAPRRFGHLLRSQAAPKVAVSVLLVVLVFAVTGDRLAPHDPYQQNLREALQGPSWGHLLGTDELGRDTLSRLIAACRLVVISSLQATGVAVIIGIPIGLLIGFVGGWLDRVVMRVVEAITALPAVVLLFTLIAVVGPGLSKAMFALGLAMSALFLRLARAEVLSAREELFVDSARVLGVPLHAILFRHVLPKALPTLLITLAFVAGTVLLAEAGLSFLGIGAQPPQASWGAMLTTAADYMGTQPFLAIPPGVAIALCVVAFNLLGDTIRDSSLPIAPPPKLSRADRRRLDTLPPLTDVATAIAVRDSSDAGSSPTETVLDVSGLTLAAPSPLGIDLPLVTGLSFSIGAGETLGFVGESGSGKSLTGLAILGLLPESVSRVAGSIRLRGTDLAQLQGAELRRFRALHTGIVFQDAMSSLDPTMTVERQVGEGLRHHAGASKAQARARVLDLLDLVGIADPIGCSRSYPHELSGGMAQRVGIAAALACEPDLIVADEPTTALDVTVQEQVLTLFHRIKSELGTAMLFITHDLSVAADTCDRVAVVYAGEIVEIGDVHRLFNHPQHPYTEALIRAHPQAIERGARLATIPGSVPDPFHWPFGCRFAPRCSHATAECEASAVPVVSVDEVRVRCRRAAELDLIGVRGDT